MSLVSIRGDGVAGRCTAALLSRAGIPIRLEHAARARLPAILLSDPACQLIQEVFELDRPFEGLPRIRKRIVAWGANAAPVTLDHSAVVISEEELLRRLRAAPTVSRPANPSWTIYAAKPLPEEAVQRRFGSRIAVAAPVELALGAESEACWMESLDHGWLFLVGNAPGRGWLLAVGEQPTTLLENSRIVRCAIASVGSPASQFPVSPAIAESLTGDSWLACGTAAIAFDPICGDGTAHAVREAILTAAVIKAALRGGATAQLLGHYRDRLTAAFLRHLLHCVEFYAPIAGDWWANQTMAAKQGIAWCGVRLGRAHAFHYRLNGLDLEPVLESSNTSGS